ncbi:MAG TPA: hypothetical protein PL029_06830 [Bacteroidia bacterium]|nr:hypothetical protein [Bacteroidia bacterium]
MKKPAIIFLNFVLLILSLPLIAQENKKQQVTPHGIFDKVFDRFGEQYDLDSLRVEIIPEGNYNSAFAIPSVSCSAGYFNLYYAPGTIWTNTPQAQTMLCQVFTGGCVLME